MPYTAEGNSKEAYARIKVTGGGYENHKRGREKVHRGDGVDVTGIANATGRRSTLLNSGDA